MKKFMSSLILSAVFVTVHFPIFAFGSTVTIFGPKQYDKAGKKPVKITDTFNVSDTSRVFTLHVWQGENGQNMAKKGFISLNGVKVIREKDLKKSTGYVSKTVDLQADNILKVKLKGKEGVFLKILITGTGGENLPSITISSPFSGEIVNKESILVTGAAYSPFTSEFSVKVNGKLAEVVGNSYFVNNVPLALGENTITATVIEADGNTAQAIITIQTDNQDQPIKLSSNIFSGIPPLDVFFLIDTNISSPIVSYNMDFDGDGTDDYLEATADNISFTYAIEGLYYVTATIIDQQNNTYTDTIAINVISKAVMDAKLQEKWDDMKTSLVNGDFTTALSYFSEGSQEKYSEIFGGLSGQLPALADNMENIELIYVKGNLAKYRIYRQQDVNGVMETITYYIYFTKDKDGFWKIRDF